MNVEHVIPEEHQALLEVWENSVRATHDFITEDDIAFFKPIILEQAFPNVTLHCVKDRRGAIQGFIGVHEGKVEMLFVLDKARGQGIGTALLMYAIEQLGATQVNVNEQNPLAVGFYQHLGFNIISRSPTDDMGKPFPILHMKREPAAKLPPIC
ncbi:GNAT family N-acetyltransferase [Pseudoalteromonas peptidolytica]|uniref:Putative acetyltransferase n=1 Tax=Pseudoalteromonas peptidolytica F12-50-A1 TaxID=1315280 RepID=A0A8I0MV07_9GAMM|nr:GNAT family N-acetyltransferase [Pseudoalteromonas peptidolytica]MBE0345913.1 putative acetyltransferase [Pseudoalteromonas peptidolytica F12-50-A1]NLR16005.1 GNAT family N-acetyltransferase [Pseudoalteromonas peptidolytica]GEK10847.1 acetyltransferase [Pseudoalteromonas peptidolytica]